LFWVDAKLFTIYSSSLDGTNRRSIFKSHNHLSHPFSVAVFKVCIHRLAHFTADPGMGGRFPLTKIGAGVRLHAAVTKHTDTYTNVQQKPDKSLNITLDII